MNKMTMATISATLRLAVKLRTLRYAECVL